MTKVEKPTLESLKKSPKLAEQHFRPSDFLTNKQIEELHEANARGKTVQRPYDDVDAFASELLARFGWETYTAWQSGKFSHEKALRFIAAERARDASKMLGLESVIYAVNAGANNPAKGGRIPKSLKRAGEIINEHHKQAKGVK